MLSLRTALPSFLLLALAAWLWSPALHGVHVEGFSATIAAIGMHLTRGDLPLLDTAYPFDAEFYTLSRLGMNGMVAGVAAVSGLGGTFALRLVVVLSFAGLVFASALFARQWSSAYPFAIAAALVLIPGLGEGAFFLHENLLAASLLTGALVACGGARRLPMAALAGVLLGGAILTRTDAVLLAPALPLVVLRATGWNRRFALALFVGGVTCSLVVLGALAALGVTPLHVLAVLQRSVVLWPQWRPPLAPVLEGVFFFGLPALALLLLGGLRVGRTGDWIARALLLGVPLLFLLIYGNKLWQSRQFLPLLPFAVVLVAEGAQTLWRDARRWPVRGGLVAVLALVWLYPTPAVFSDGPRSLTGRLWSPLVWRDWQSSVDRNFSTIQAAIAGLPQGGFILTDDWNTDRYLHLALLDAGFAAQPPGVCGANVEVFARGPQVIAHVRLHLPFFSSDRYAALPPLLARFETGCRPTRPAAPLLYLSAEPTPRAWLGGAAPTPTLALPWLEPPAYAFIAAHPLDPAALDRLRAAYARMAQAGGRSALGDEDLDRLIDQLRALTPLLMRPGLGS